MDDTANKPITGRTISALLNPRPVLLVTCCDENGIPNALPIAWHTPLSHEPPLLGISVNKKRYSHGLITATGEFVVNVLGRDFQSVLEYCGSCSGAELDKLAAAGLSLRPARQVRPPVIGEALAHLECRVKEQMDAGDHTFFLAHVLHAEVKEGSFADCFDAAVGNVLLCLQRDLFATWSPL